MRVLIVEDDSRAVRFLRQGLEEEGHGVDVAADGEEGLQLGLHTPYDVIVLDTMLPRRDGLSVAAELRRQGIASPILMLTGRDTTADVVRGLDAGADDYLSKLFDFDELLARVRALGRRQATGGLHGLLRVGDLEMDRLRRRARRGPHFIELSPREFQLLEHLMLHADQVLTRTNLLEKVWNMDFDPGTNVVEAHLSNLRKKLEQSVSRG